MEDGRTLLRFGCRDAEEQRTSTRKPHGTRMKENSFRNIWPETRCRNAMLCDGGGGSRLDAYWTIAEEHYLGMLMTKMEIYPLARTGFGRWML
jgi:hypothetical protein